MDGPGDQARAFWSGLGARADPGRAGALARTGRDAQPRGGRLVALKTIDEVQRLVNQHSLGVVIEAAEGEDAYWRGRYFSLGSMMLKTVDCPGAMQASMTHEGYLLTLALLGSSTVETSGTTIQCAPGVAGVIHSPGSRSSHAVEPGFQGLSVIIDPAFMEGHFRLLTGASPRAPIVFSPLLHVAEEPGLGLSRLLQFVAAEMSRHDGLAASPLVVANLRDTVATALLAHQPHSHRSFFERPPHSAGPRYVRHVIDYIEAHAHEPITMADLSAVAGVSIRALQAAFRTHRGVTPKAFLQTRRIELARERLLSGAMNLTVTQVAMDSGFAHLGRFSIAYRRTFGECPSDTLRRGRPGHREVCKD